MPSCRAWPRWPCYVICVAVCSASPERSHDSAGCQGSALLQVRVTPEASYLSSKSDVATKITKESTNVSWFPTKYPRISMAMAVVIVLVGCWSAVYEPSSNQSKDSRDGVWDVIKFALILCVFHYHISGRFWGGVQALLPRWYAGFMMPCFMIISGFHSQSGRVKIERVFRDNVINNYMMTFLLMLLYQFALIGNANSYWFLWALAFYRLCLGPLFSILMQYLGGIAGRVACILIGLAVSFTPYLPSLVSVEEQAFWLFGGERHFVTQHAVFFAVGFSIDPTFRSMVSKPMVQIVAVLFMAMQVVSCLSLDSEIVKALEVLIQHEDLGVGDGLLIACRNVPLRVLASFSFIACITFLYDAGLVPSTIQRCGRRTLYAYMLERPFNAFFGFSLFHFWMESHGFIFVVLSISLQLLLVIALSSPFCERIFCWIISPQWFLDIFDGCKVMITGRWKLLNLE